MNYDDLLRRRFSEYKAGFICRANNKQPLSSDFYSRDFAEGYYGTHKLNCGGGGYRPDGEL